MPKLAIISSHPIQYYAPMFKLLAKEIPLKVFYCHNPSAEEIGKDGFGKEFEWDVNLLSGYKYEFLENHSEKPSLSSFNGCDTPQIGEKLKNYGATHVVVFGWYLKSFIQALNYCNKNNIIVAARGDSQLNPRLPMWKKVLKKIYYPYFLKKYDAFLYVGKRNRKYLKYYGVPEKKLIFSPHAVDQEFWKNQNRILKGNFIFIWVGKMIPIKRPQEVVQAFIKAFQGQTNIELWMVGTGELYEEVKSSAKSDKIKFLGFKNQTELLELYNKSDCLILSSESETWGLVVNEAMSCGLPAIVSSACGCSDDMVEDNKTGYIYESKSMEELKKKMAKAITRNKPYYAAGLREKNKVYSYNRNIQSFEEFLKMKKRRS